MEPFVGSDEGYSAGDTLGILIHLPKKSAGM